MIKLRVRLCALIISSVLLLAVAVFFAVRTLQDQVNSYTIDLASKLSQKLGYNVTIGQVNSGWDWLYLKVTLSDVKVIDNEMPIFMADKIVGKIDVLTSIINWRPHFGNIILKSPRISLDWNGIGAPTVLSLSGQQIATSEAIDPALLWQLLAVQRRITIIDGDLHLQGKYGADLPFMQVQLDFVQRGDSQYRLTARGMIAAPTPPEFMLALNYHGDLTNFNHALINFEIKTSALSVKEILRFVPNYDQTLISGSFHDFDVKGTIQNGQIHQLNSAFNINHLGVGLLSFDQGIGRIEYRPESNKIKISGNNLQLASQQLYDKPIRIDQISGELENIYDQNTHYLLTKNLEIRALGMELDPALKLKISDNQVTALELTSGVKRGNLPRLLQLLPDKIISKNLHQWLKNSLVAGNITDFNFTYIPDKYYVDFGLAGTEVKYSNNWPSIKDISARVKISDNNINMLTSKASVDGQAINQITVNYVITPQPWQPIILQGDINTTLEASLAYLAKTPLKTSLADKLANIDPKGPMHVELTLNVDVNSPDTRVGVNGDMNLDHVTLNLQDIDLQVRDLVGNLHFTNGTLQADNLHLSMLGQAASATVKSLSTGALEIGFRTPLAMTEVKRLFPMLSNMPINGDTQINGTVTVPWSDAKATQVIKINSDLQGIAIDYPPPFAKAADSVLPLHLEYHLRPQQTKMLNLDFANVLSAALFLQDGEFYGGNVVLGAGKAAHTLSDCLVISGKLENFVWQDWENLLQAEDNFSTMPVLLDLRFGTLAINDTEYKDSRIKYDSAQRLWKVENAIVAGEFSLTDKKDKLVINLQRLNLNTKADKNSKEIKNPKEVNNAVLDFFRTKHVAGELPLVQFFCENLTLNEREYRKVGLQLLPRTYGYEINDFSIANDNILLQAQGQWQMKPGEEFTQLSGNIYTKNFGKILRDWQFGNSITRGAGELNFSLEWPGDPAAFDHLHLRGASHFDLRNGSLTSVKPGLGRLIGLLSMDSIQRRLQLDFHDLTDQGLAFDKFVADLKFEPGKLESNNILITSPAAKIELDGKLNLKSQALDFNLYVTPKIAQAVMNAGAVAIAAANPAVGAAIWLFDKAAGSKLSDMTKYRYKVSGNWDKPKIEEIFADVKKLK